METERGTQGAADARRRAEHFLPVRNEMGETPVWVPASGLSGRVAVSGAPPGAPPGAPGMGVLYWLDAEGGSVYHWDPQSAHFGYRLIETPVKSLVRRASRGFVAVAEKGLFFWDAGDRQAESPPSGSPAAAGMEIDSPGNDFRLMPGTAIQDPHISYNGASVDRQGRLLVNTYGETDVAAEQGSILRIERGGLPVEIDRGLALPKGMCVSPDGRRLFLGEMLKKRILVYDYDPRKGAVSNRRVFAEMAGDEGVPDGLTVDGEGFVWCAHWGGWRVTRYAPDGAKERVFPLPVSIVTAVGFGGEGLGDLFIATARFGLSDQEKETQPLAGDLFRVRTGVGGVAEAGFLE